MPARTCADTAALRAQQTAATAPRAQLRGRMTMVGRCNGGNLLLWAALFGLAPAPAFAVSLRTASERPAMPAAAGNGPAWGRPYGGGQLSHDGRWLVYASAADNLVDDDHNALPDIYLRDLERQRVIRVNVGRGGAEADGDSESPSVSADGRRVAFQSFARNLVEGDSNQRSDVFVADLAAGWLRRVSLGSAGLQGNGHSALARISADGRRVVYTSAADNLVAGDANQHNDVFVHDLAGGDTVLVSRAADGTAANGRSEVAALSGDGRFVAFASHAANLLPDDDNGAADVYLRDLLDGRLERISVTPEGTLPGNRESGQPALSDDGRFVAFTSAASDLVPGDSNGCEDVFVRDRWLRLTWRVSVGRAGAQAQAASSQPVLSANGMVVAFVSSATLDAGGAAGDTVQVWRHAWKAGWTSLASVDRRGRPGEQHSLAPALSGDGRWLSFHSRSGGWSLDHGQVSGHGDVFVAGDWTW